MVVFSDNVTAIIDVFESVIIIDRLFDAPAGRVIRVVYRLSFCRVRGWIRGWIRCTCPLHIVHPAAIVTIRISIVLKIAPFQRVLSGNRPEWHEVSDKR